jgi:glycosyltransferase EpsD
LLVGDGPLSAQYEDQVSRLDLKDHVHFLEYRKDIPELLKLSDVAVSSSRREGLPLNVLEAMAMELPLVVTNSRGNRDLVWNAKNGFVVHDDVGEFTDAILKLYQSREMREKFGLANRLRMEKYSLDTIMAAMKEIYEGLLENSDLTGSELDNG